MQSNTAIRYSKWVKLWLLTGVIMIFFQVFIGGITRLTGSGLSITKWEIITGTIPPVSAEQWQKEFELYQQTPQYQKINDGMSMSEFKFIYFWEYIHRLWARLMGFVFLIPLILFLVKKQIDRPLLTRLIIVFLLAALVASFGWIMVASGLINRPWVNAYKLTMHLSLAIILFSYLLWTVYLVFFPDRRSFGNVGLRRFGLILNLLLGIQIILGGIMSGMKAALFFPTWPDLNGAWVPSILLEDSMWTYEHFINYDLTPFMSAIIQLLHRNTAYLITFLIAIFIYYGWLQLKKENNLLFRNGLILLGAVVVIQVLLGILTLLYSQGTIPVGLGVAHQSGAILLLGIALFQLFLMGKSKAV